MADAAEAHGDKPGVRLFIDEDLSPRLVAVGHDRGYDATCVRDRSRLGRTDADVLALCIAEDRVLVTGNAADFTNLCGGVELHPGPITLPDCNLATQQRLLEVALSFVEVAAKRAKRSPRSFMLNRVVEVDVAGRCEHYELPTA